MSKPHQDVFSTWRKHPGWFLHLLFGQNPEVAESDLGAVVLEEDRTRLRPLGLAGPRLVLELVVVMDLHAVPDQHDPRPLRLLPRRVQAPALERHVVALPLALL